MWTPDPLCISLLCFFCNRSATTEIYTLSLHDALPIYGRAAAVLIVAPDERSDIRESSSRLPAYRFAHAGYELIRGQRSDVRSEEHTSELQSRQYLVCRLLLEKKKNIE